MSGDVKTKPREIKVQLNKYFTIVKKQTVYTLISPSEMHLYKGKVFQNEGVDFTVEPIQTNSSEYTLIKARMKSKKPNYSFKGETFKENK
jgi:hypothetical protein